MKSPLSALSLLAVLASACSDNTNRHVTAPPAEEPDLPEILAGERLFLESRFAQFFAVNAAGNLNLPLVAGDPALDTLEIGGAQVPSPFAGSTMSCSACHLVDQALGLPGGSMRTYDDFAVGSPLTARPDGLTRTPRNSPPLVNASIARMGETVFHFDAEFTTLEELALETLLGRNYGWLSSERALAIAHVAAVIRADDGQGELAAGFGSIPYSVLLDLNGTGVPSEFALPPIYQVDMATASDLEIAQAVATLIAAYTRGLVFARDQNDLYSGSPYDAFLAKNGLPQAPDPGETPLDYARRLALAVEALSAPQFVEPDPSGFQFHAHAFVFGPEELAGLRVFLREPGAPPGLSVGNCVACHTPPDFTDFELHNVGFSQAEYDAAHGPGAFAGLHVPTLAERNAHPEAYLPPSVAYPNAAGPFRARVDPTQPGLADLGLWNVFANPAMPAPQASIASLLGTIYGPAVAGLADARKLPFTEGLFKTPGLRDLGHGGPYGRSGFFAALDEVLFHYVQFSGLARAGLVRNADRRLVGVQIGVQDIGALEALLLALDEDYE